MSYAHQRKVFGKPLIESEVIRNKLAHMSRVVESQQAWIEVGHQSATLFRHHPPTLKLCFAPHSQSIIYSIKHLPHDEANRRLGGTTALLKAHSSIVLDMVAKEAVQCFGGLGVTRGGKGDRVERIRRDVTGVTIPGGAEPILLDNGVKQEVRLALGLGAKL